MAHQSAEPKRCHLARDGRGYFKGEEILACEQAAVAVTLPKPQTSGRPRINREVEELIVRMAEENRSWGYDRIVGALANLGHEISDQTVGNVLQRHGLPPAPERKHTTTWATFIRTHLAVLAGTDFFTAEVLTLRGLVTYYVLFFIHLESRKVDRNICLGHL
jgi:hypothetical protein